MSLLFLDLETNGLPQTPSFGKWYPYTDIEKYSSSRVLSICMYLYKKGVCINKFYTLINEEVEVNETEIHGITQEEIKTKGMNWNEVSNIIDAIIDNSEFVIGHNILFDKNVLCSELYRNGYQKIAAKLNNKSLYCTMINGKILLKLEKYPKLKELYSSLFKKEMKGSHNAKMDVKACIACYFQMMKGV
jgi:DNA polymerase III epsilon subunit-like protein